MQFLKGKCLLIPSGPNDYKHLFTILIEPTLVSNMGAKPQLVSVSFTSIRENINYDDACVVQAGEHPFIKQPSYLNYRYARIDSVEHIQNLVTKGTFIEKEPCSQKLLNKIICGAFKSKRISKEIRNI